MLGLDRTELELRYQEKPVQAFTPAEWCVSAPELLILQQLILSQIKGIRQAS